MTGQSLLELEPYGRGRSRRGRPAPLGGRAIPSREDLQPQSAPREGMGFEPTPDQARAVDEIVAAYGRGDRCLLTGAAGTGKTSTLLEVISRFVQRRLRVVATAPTHQAVKVIRQKMADAGFSGVEARTLQSLLSLRPEPSADRMVFKRAKHAEPVIDDVVILDEVSMASLDLMRHIRMHLPMSFVLFSGDAAQLPPVGEGESEAFGTRRRFVLTQIIRQAEGNPLLRAALAVRDSQAEEAMDWSWVRQDVEAGQGLYTLSDEQAERWLRKAFTSPDFDAHPDSFRVVAWRNRRVASLNERIRAWRYGEEARKAPLTKGEIAIFRRPVMRDEAVLFATNEETRVKAIAPDTFKHRVRASPTVEEWEVRFPSWRITCDTADGREVEVHMPQDHDDLRRAVDRLKVEALRAPRSESGERWARFHELQEAVADARPCYAMTVHSAQGSTHGLTFVDLSDIADCVKANPWEGKRMLYTALTRPRRAAALFNL